MEKINRVVIFTLESFYSGQAITRLVEKYKDKIVLICLSQRFGGKYGSFYYQLKKNFKRSGFHFVNYLSFHLVYYKSFVYIIDFINKILRRKKRIYTIYQLSQKYRFPIIKTKEVKDFNTIQAIKYAKPDLIISAYFDQVINQEIINIPQYGVINIHTGLLPGYKGPFPTFWPVIKGEKVGGVTIHFVNKKLDEGDILLKKEIEINYKESILSMDCKLMNVGVDLIFDVIKEIENNNISPQKQSIGCYYSFPTKKDLKNLKERGIKLYTIKDFIKAFI
jgi:methionyl-tRNA formyltransferase